MARKPNRMYREIRGMAYTRREYMGGIPGLRIAQFDMGAPAHHFSVVVTLRVKEQCQIRHTALEAARIAANRYMQRRAGNQGYHLKIRVYPHNVLRENKTATGAGADRISDGMRHAFGKPVGVAARTQKDQAVISIWTSPANFHLAKNALRRAGQKLPSPVTITIDQGAELIRG